MGRWMDGRMDRCHHGFTHSFLDVHVDCLPALGVVNNAAMSVGAWTSF